MGAFDDVAADRELEVLTWDGFGEAARDLARTIVGSGWMPDIVVAVARGGLLPAGALAYALGIKAMGTLNVEFYTGVGETLPEPVVLPPLMDTSEFPGQRVLIVDDVADSGKTLDLVVRMIRTQGLPADVDGDGIANDRIPVDVRSAVLYTKPSSIIAPDYTWKATAEWIAFPWSDKPAVTAES
ncbi:phosphoribosyltransferase [Microbacterium gorillae]|uniref:phosphoribosyltransferase n=1 Tax=Microbacterium gorillae TaxID=1231063 RepID=UPI00058DE314|nr:phosphoribosyltransferase [Microbacterium gorillae]